MADRNPQVMEMVVQELDRNPDVDLETLYGQAREIDTGIGDLSLRQFHARYPLQAKRARSRGRTGGAKRPRGRGRRAAGEKRQPARSRSAAAGGGDRERVRAIFLEFAGDFAQAESKAEIVRVLGDVDAYVDRVIRTVGG